MTWFEGFEACRVDVGDGSIFARVGGRPGAPPLLMLHGFPQTHAMWHRVAVALSGSFRLVLPDLRGYGDSFKPPDDPQHANHSKRAMAQDVAKLMAQLGHEHYAVVGHDRGARVAHRLALDFAVHVERLCLIDIAPTLDMYAATDMAFARAYYHWFHLIQPAPLPERMIGGDARSYLHAKLGGWGAAGLAHVEAQALADYERCFCTADAIHAACEDYRASADIDLEHDRASRAAGEQIACDTLVLWGSRGVVQRLFQPLALWQAQCRRRVSGEAMPAGHFIPEELPLPTAQRLLAFMT